MIINPGFSAEEKKDDVHSLPPGGATGQLLGKTGAEDYKAGWVNAPATGVTSFKSRTGAVTPQSGDYSVSQVTGAAPTASPVFTGSISMGRKSGTTVGSGSCAEGINTTASGSCSHAEGNGSTASGVSSHAEGDDTTASGPYSHAEGSKTKASDSSSHAEGSNSTASGPYSHAEGYGTTASGSYSHAAGSSTTASGVSSHAGGSNTIAYDYQTVVGTFNVENTASDATSGARFIVGGGWGTRKNAFRVDASGACYGTGSWHTSGADYAELFEWLDGNPNAEDRAGLFVTIDGDRIRVATPEDDYIIGVVSACPSVVGDVYDDQWAGMYLRDVFGRTVMAEQDFPAQIGPDGKEIIPAFRALAPVVNPDYDPTKPYLPRSQRPEWDAVGMLGKLVAVDDGTCEVNGWCTVGEGGVATRSGTRTKYRVMARLDETHVRVLIL